MKEGGTIQRPPQMATWNIESHVIQTFNNHKDVIVNNILEDKHLFIYLFK